jgi:hypothetical protein
VLRKLFKKPEQDTVDAGQLSVVPPGSPLDAVLAGGAPRLQGAANPMAGLPTVPAPTVAMPQPVPVAPRATTEHLSPFERLQADVDALAEAAPDRTAEYLRALMAEGAGA